MLRKLSASVLAITLSFLGFPSLSFGIVGDPASSGDSSIIQDVIQGSSDLESFVNNLTIAQQTAGIVAVETVSPGAQAEAAQASDQSFVDQAATLQAQQEAQSVQAVETAPVAPEQPAEAVSQVDEENASWYDESTGDWYWYDANGDSEASNEQPRGARSPTQTPTAQPTPPPTVVINPNGVTHLPTGSTQIADALEAYFDVLTDTAVVLPLIDGPLLRLGLRPGMLPRIGTARAQNAAWQQLLAGIPALAAALAALNVPLVLQWEGNTLWISYNSGNNTVVSLGMGFDVGPLTAPVPYFILQVQNGANLANPPPPIDQIFSTPAALQAAWQQQIFQDTLNGLWNSIGNGIQDLWNGMNNNNSNPR